ncbi:unnamed protein product [Oppiella nova]|uniref:C2H2-type domain-containing protein n=1 Tax=Oppiella nova TaxID=334625 RepID=A0A7R9M791_9ACAR|nr:unnamed protein product [Oppiella nova]CAG2171802.1 unnamed protein product [Oppiella nova]
MSQMFSVVCVNQCSDNQKSYEKSLKYLSQVLPQSGRRSGDHTRQQSVRRDITNDETIGGSDDESEDTTECENSLGSDKTCDESNGKTRAVSDGTSGQFVCHWSGCGKRFTSIADMCPHKPYDTSVGHESSAAEEVDKQLVDTTSQTSPNQMKSISSEESAEEYSSGSSDTEMSDKCDDNNRRQRVHKKSRTDPKICDKTSKDTERQHRKYNRKYRCDYIGCGKTFQNQMFLKNHRHVHTSHVYRCDWKACTAVFATQHYLNNHIKVCHDSEYRCDREPSPPALVASPREPVKRVRDKILRCGYGSCQFTVRGRVGLTQHRLRAHTVCQLRDCGKAFKRYPDLRRHQLIVHPDDMPDPWLQCPQTDCPFRSKSNQRLNEHLAADHSTRHQCPVCGKSYGTAYQLQQHESAHNPELRVRCEWEGCGKVLAHKESLASHMKSHTMPGVYRCCWPGCDKSYTFKRSLEAHEQIAHLPKTYRCDVCGQLYGRLCDRNTHQLTHDTSARVRCEWPECGQVFKNGKCLSAHTNVHTMARPYRCPYEGCAKVYGNKTSFNSHKMSHKKCN